MVPSAASPPACVTFQVDPEIPEKHRPNEVQAQRLYYDACNWVEKYVVFFPGARFRPLRPCVTVVLVPELPEETRKYCPEHCVDRSGHTIYLRKRWDPGAFIQGVIQIAVFERTFGKEFEKELIAVAQQILNRDSDIYLDARKELE